MRKKFYVKVYEVHTLTIPVMAEDKEDARRVAGECLESGENEDGTFIDEAIYDYTLDEDDWTVCE